MVLDTIKMAKLKKGMAITLIKLFKIRCTIVLSQFVK